jgi:hypothetical protein
MILVYQLISIGLNQFTKLKRKIIMDIEAIKSEMLKKLEFNNSNNDKLGAIRWLRDQTGLTLTHCNNLLEKWLSERNPLQKVITWHPISEIPDIDPDEPEFSKIVLGIEGTSTCEAYCRMDTKEWLYHGVDHKRPFAATHWSYIDFLPE